MKRSAPATRQAPAWSFSRWTMCRLRLSAPIDDLGIEVTEDTVSFPWFTEMPEPEEVKAYTHFIAALGKMSRDLKRISATEKEVDNEKYAFRCLLLRLGFKGTVTGVDDTGSLMVNWDNCSGLNVIYGIDRVRKVVD